MWCVGFFTMTRRSGLSFLGKDASMFILSNLDAPPSSWRSNIAGCAAKEFVLRCLLHISTNVELGFGGFLIVWSSSVRSLVGS